MIGDPYTVFQFEMKDTDISVEEFSNQEIRQQIYPSVSALRWNEDGKYLCVGGTDGSLNIIDISTQKCLLFFYIYFPSIIIIIAYIYINIYI